MFDKKYIGTLEDAKLLISKINEVYSLKIDSHTCKKTYIWVIISLSYDICLNWIFQLIGNS